MMEDGKRIDQINPQVKTLNGANFAEIRKQSMFFGHALLRALAVWRSKKQ